MKNNWGSDFWGFSMGKGLVRKYLPAYEDGRDRVFRNVSIYNSDAGESHRRKHKIFRIGQKF